MAHLAPNISSLQHLHLGTHNYANSILFLLPPPTDATHWYEQIQNPHTYTYNTAVQFTLERCGKWLAVQFTSERQTTRCSCSVHTRTLYFQAVQSTSERHKHQVQQFSSFLERCTQAVQSTSERHKSLSPTVQPTLNVALVPHPYWSTTSPLQLFSTHLNVEVKALLPPNLSNCFNCAA